MDKEYRSKLSELMLGTNRNWFSQRLLDGFLVEVYSLKKVTEVKSIDREVCIQTFLVQDKLEASFRTKFLSQALMLAKVYHVSQVDNLRDIILDVLESNSNREVDSVAQKVYDMLPVKSCFKVKSSIPVIEEKVKREIEVDLHKRNSFLSLTNLKKDLDSLVEIIRLGDERSQFGSEDSNLRYFTDGSKVFIGDEDDPVHDNGKFGGFAETIKNLETDGVLIYSLLIEAQKILGMELEFSSKDEESVESIDKSLLHYSYIMGGVKLYENSLVSCNGCKEKFDSDKAEILHASATCKGAVYWHLHYCHSCYGERFGKLIALDC